MKTIRLSSGATITTYPAAPEGVPLLDADDRVLAKYGLTRPIGNPDLLHRWTQQMRHTRRLVEPAFRMLERSSGAPRPGLLPEPTESDIWAGVRVRAPSGSSIASVTGQWTIPDIRLAAPGYDQHVSFWIGVDGEDPRRTGRPKVLVQAGVECDVGSDGVVTVYPWWEWVPDGLVRILNPSARIGDVISCMLTITSNTSATLFFTNITERYGSTFHLTAPHDTVLPGATAEWIAERPQIGGAVTSLADFGTVDFIRCGAFSHTGGKGLSDRVILAERSPVSPALASLGGRLFLAWKGDGNDSLNLIASDDGGLTFSGKLTLAETSPQPPALCAHDGKLFLAWIGDGTDQLNVAQVEFAGATIIGLTRKVALRETSPLAPALASLGTRLYLAWKGDGNDLLNLVVSTDDGLTFAHKHTFAETSPRAPALCALDGSVYLAWSAGVTDVLHVAQVATAGDTITGLAAVTALPETTPASPALASIDHRLVVSWKGDGNNFLSAAYSDDGGATFGDKLISPERSPVAPALTAHAGGVVIAWKGDGNNLLSVAKLGFAGGVATRVSLTTGEPLTMEDTAMDKVLATGTVIGEDVVRCEFAAGRLSDRVKLLETSPDRPAIAALGDRLYLAWKGDGNDRLSVAYSADAGATFGHKLITAELSPQAPALCAHRGDLIMAWRADGSDAVNVARVAITGPTISGVVDRVALGETTSVSPALASLDPMLVLAWKGDGDDAIHLAISGDGGRTFGPTHTSSETTRSSPGLVSDGSRVFVTWRGPDDRLNLATVAIAGSTVTGLIAKITLDERSATSPAFAYLDKRLFIVWKGDGDDYLHGSVSIDLGNHLGERFTAPDHSTTAPALCSDRSSVYIAWRDDGDQLIVAKVRFL